MYQVLVCCSKCQTMNNVLPFSSYNMQWLLTLMFSSQLRNLLELTNDSPEIFEGDFAINLKLGEVCYCSHLVILGSLGKREAF